MVNACFVSILATCDNDVSIRHHRDARAEHIMLCVAHYHASGCIGDGIPNCMLCLATTSSSYYISLHRFGEIISSFRRPHEHLHAAHIERLSSTLASIQSQLKDLEDNAAERVDSSLLGNSVCTAMPTANFCKNSEVVEICSSCLHSVYIDEMAALYAYFYGKATAHLSTG